MLIHFAILQVEKDPSQSFAVHGHGVIERMGFMACRLAVSSLLLGWHASNSFDPLVVNPLSWSRVLGRSVFSSCAWHTTDGAT